MNTSNLRWLLIAVVAAACSSGPAPADLIIFGGTIHTVNPAAPVVEAVVVRGDSIVHAGAKSEAMNYKGSSTRLIDLAGRTMTPGFIEGHGHIMGLGYNEMNLDLMGMKNFDEVVEKVRAAAANAKPGEWILGRGWHQELSLIHI